MGSEMCIRDRSTMSLNKPNTLHDTFREVEKVVYEIEKRFKE